MKKEMKARERLGLLPMEPSQEVIDQRSFPQGYSEWKLRRQEEETGYDYSQIIKEERQKY